MGLEFGLHTTIYRPGVIIGSSADGKTTTFNGYNYLAKVFYRQREKILQELQNNPGKFAGSGIRKTASGVALPVRIPCSVHATVNLVTIDYAIETMLKLASNRGSVGKVFHITNPNPPKGRKLFNMSADVIGIEGISFVEKLETLQSDPPTNPVLRRYEQKIFREISVCPVPPARASFRQCERPRSPGSRLRTALQNRPKSDSKAL